MSEWTDLSDSELRARLEQRGVECLLAERLVEDREDPEWARVIAKVLAR